MMLKNVKFIPKEKYQKKKKKVIVTKSTQKENI